MYTRGRGALCGSLRGEFAAVRRRWLAWRRDDASLAGHPGSAGLAVAPQQARIYLAMVPFTSIHARVARPASARRNIAKTLVQIVVMWSIFYGLLPAAIYRLENNSDLRRFRFSSTRWRVVGSA